MHLLSIDCNIKHQQEHPQNTKLTPDPFFLVKQGHIYQTIKSLASCEDSLCSVLHVLLCYFQGIMTSHCILVVHITLYAACWNFLNILFLFSQGSLWSRSNVGWTLGYCMVFKKTQKETEKKNHNLFTISEKFLPARAISWPESACCF